MKKLLPLFCLLLLFAACSADEEYSTRACRFAYDNSLYLDETLASAMNSQSRGIFCHVSETSQAGARWLVFRSNNDTESRKQEMAQEQRASYILGMNNGIIVGFQTLNTQPNGGFVAYDAQCANCVRLSGNSISPKYPLSMASSGIATCSKCHRRYDMNNGGIVLNGIAGDVGMEKYLATTTGPYGYISVTTRR